MLRCLRPSLANLKAGCPVELRMPWRAIRDLNSIRLQRYSGSTCPPPRAVQITPFGGRISSIETSAVPRPEVDNRKCTTSAPALGLSQHSTCLSARSGYPPLQRELHTVAFEIALPELEISVAIASEDAASAGVAACLAFKAEFEHVVRSGSLPVRYQGRNTGLTVKTASAFIAFFIKNNHRQPKPQWRPTHNHDVSGFVNATLDVRGPGRVVTLATSRDAAADFAKLVTAVRFAKIDPDMVTAFHQDVKRRARLSPISLNLPSSVLEIMENVTQPALLQELKLDDSDAIPSSLALDSRPFSRYPLPDGPSKDILKKLMHRRRWTFETAPEFEKMRAHLASLPMSQYREEVLRMVRHSQNPFSIVVGATGSGKTTQVPQIILDDAIRRGEGADCNVICTQPRRIAATSVAARVALPRPHGSITFCTTGILLAQIKADADGVLNYASHIVIDEVHERDLDTDYIIAMLKKSINARQKSGLPVPKVVLMSATLDTELFANYLGTPRSGREKISVQAPSISVPGRTFPIQNRFLDDIMPDLYESHLSAMENLLQEQFKVKRYLDQEIGAQLVVAVSTEANPPKGEPPSDQANKVDGRGRSAANISAEEQHEEFVPVQLVAAVVARIVETTETGAILVFLPGLKEILDTERALGDDIFNVGFRSKYKFRVHRLHSSVPREEQNAVFEDPPPGCRKIILSTNIAETSVTVPDVQHVVDAGKLRETRYDQLTGVGGLRCVWESMSNSRQRAGRAGRVQNGFYHALFSRERYARMAPTGLPELLRTDLQGTCLAIKKQHPDQVIDGVMQGFIQPPPGAAVSAAVRQLKRINALTKKEEELTPLGRLLATLPVHPTLAKMIVMGVIFRCLDPMIILGAAACETRLFAVPPGQTGEARASHSEFGGHNSDHISMLQAYDELRTCRAEYGEELAKDRAFTSFLRWSTFKSIRHDAESILNVLIRCGLAPASDHDLSSELQYGPPSLNTNSRNHELIRGLLAGGLNPNLAANTSGWRQFTYRDGSGVNVHHSSQNATAFGKKFFADRGGQAVLIAFNQLERASGSSKVLSARDTTMVPPLTAFLFADDGVRHEEEDVVTLAGWLPFLVTNADTLDATVLGGSDDGGRRANARHSRDVLLRFKSFLHGMLDRAYSDLSKLQRLHYDDEWEWEGEEGEEEDEPSSPPAEPPVSLPDFVEDSLRKIATNAVVVMLDEMKKQPVRKITTSTAGAAAAAAPVVVTNRRDVHPTRMRIERRQTRDSSVVQAAET
ncbi:hypothetical protein PG996_016057 [Apiospora saccharicola]|uniref:RNA helicase n=1 Tax=Apiospora saccharicola TaxID=335842 RepID=A0ABR1TN04_9PEZI